MDPYPGSLYGAFARFFPQSIDLPPVRIGSATQHYPKQRLQLRTPFRGCSHSFMFKPPDLLATQVAPTDTLKPYGSRDFYFRAP